MNRKNGLTFGILVGLSSMGYAGQPADLSRLTPLGCNGCNLSGLQVERDLSQFKLADNGQVYLGGSFKGANFNGANLQGVTFQGDLTGATFKGAYLAWVNFESAMLKNSKTGQPIKPADLGAAFLKYAIWTDGKMCADEKCAEKFPYDRFGGFGKSRRPLQVIKNGVIVAEKSDRTWLVNKSWLLRGVCTKDSTCTVEYLLPADNLDFKQLLDDWNLIIGKEEKKTYTYPTVMAGRGADIVKVLGQEYTHVRATVYYKAPASKAAQKKK